MDHKVKKAGFLITLCAYLAIIRDILTAGDGQIFQMFFVKRRGKMEQFFKIPLVLKRKYAKAQQLQSRQQGGSSYEKGMRSCFVDGSDRIGELIVKVRTRGEGFGIDSHGIDKNPHDDVNRNQQQNDARYYEIHKRAENKSSH